MLRPVLCCDQCDETGVRVVHKRRSIQHAKHGFSDVKYVHISQQFLVEQLHCDRCDFIGAVIAISCVLAAGEKLDAACCSRNPVSNLKCGTTMVLESSTTFLCIVTVSFVWCPVENPLATDQNCQAINTKSGLLSERKWQYDKS
jgi:hypothetical protein